ncbi:MAG: elongation factor G [Spirochaetaceae bacterium]
MSTSTESIRNIAVIGHGGTGKTTFVEHLLFTGGAIAKPETVESGKTTSDHTEEEVANTQSVHTTLTHINWKNAKINILDTPGASDFAGEVVVALRVCEAAVAMVGAKDGVQIETIKTWRRLDARNKSRIVFVNKLDEEMADFSRTMNDLAEKFDARFVPVSIPMGVGADFGGVIDLISMKAYPVPGAGAKEKAGEIPEEYREQAEEARAALVEAAAEGDDELLTKYLEDESLSEEELKAGLAAGFAANTLVPVACGAALSNAGITSFLEVLAIAGPAPSRATETVVREDGAEEEMPITSEGPLAALCFKTRIDQFSGKLSFVKVVRGTLSAESEIANVREAKKEKISKIHTAQGKKLEDIDALNAGDVGVLTKVASAKVNDTLAAPEAPVTLKPLDLPQPVHAVAIEVPDRKAEDRLAEQLHRAQEEDLTFTVTHDEETKETVIAGMGELHLNMILDKIKQSQKIDVHTKLPKVAYRETIQKTADATYRHKKQSGGHGQFGEVVIKIFPLERGQYYSFENLIRGMAVSKGYVPGIEKGLLEAMKEGFIAGYPAVDVGVQLLDGKEHPVDSSEMAFKAAAKGAMKEAVQKAKPTLLEPVMNLEVFIEEQYLGDVLSDLTARRGRVQGQEQIGGGFIVIKAQVPQAELLRYSIDLRSITSGTGGFEMEFSHYEPISGRIADEVIKQAEAEKAEA